MKNFKIAILSLTVLIFFNSCREEEGFHLTGLVEDAWTKQQVADANISFDSGKKLKSDLDGTFKYLDIIDGQYQVVCNKEGYLKFDTIINVPGIRNMKIVLQPIVSLVAKPAFLDFGKSTTDMYLNIYNPFDDSPTKKFTLSNGGVSWFTTSLKEVDIPRQSTIQVKVRVNRAVFMNSDQEGRITINVDPNPSKYAVPSVTVRAEK